MTTTPTASPELPDLDTVIAYLLGEGPLIGQNFGDKPLDGTPYWWRAYLRAAALHAQPEGEAPQAGWSVEKDAHGRFCVRDSGGARSITEEDEPTLYRFFSAQSAATLSPLCGAQHAESGKPDKNFHVEYRRGYAAAIADFADKKAEAPKGVCE